MKYFFITFLIITYFTAVTFANEHSDNILTKSIQNIENEIAEIEIQVAKNRLENAVDQCIHDDSNIEAYCSQMIGLMKKASYDGQERQKHLKLKHLGKFIMQLVENRVENGN